jgi:hypothetical protein
MKSSLPTILLAFALLPAWAQSPPEDPPLTTPSTPRPAWRDKLYFGGGVGLSFGDIDYVEVAPLVGYQLNPRISFGVGAFYRWTSDDRYTPSLDTSDYGASVFSRINIVPPIYAHVEYEFVNYEYLTFAGTNAREGDSNVLVGLGFFQPTGGRSGFYASALYNLMYDEDDPTSPYDSPWVYRIGFTIGF